MRSRSSPNGNGHHGIDAIVAEPADPRTAKIVASLPDAPLVCVSIYDRTSDFAELHPSAYLEKPFGLVQLERAIEGALELSREGR
jgi:hypothetical protein